MTQKSKETFLNQTPKNNSFSGNNNLYLFISKLLFFLLSVQHKMRRVSWPTILIMVIVALLVVEHVVVPAAAGRVLMEKSGDGRATVMSVEKMKSTVGSWFQRLASGPSPRGRGH